MRAALAHLSGAGDLAGLLDELLEELHGRFGVTHAMVLMRDPARGTLYSVASRGYPQSGIGKKTQEGDVLIIRTDPDKLASIDQEPGIAIRPLEKYRETLFPDGNGASSKETLAPRLVQSVVAPRSVLIGKRIGKVDFLQNYGVIIVGVWRSRGWLTTELSRVRLREGDVLVMTGEDSSFKRISEDQSFLMLVPFKGEPKPLHKARQAAAIMILATAVAALNIVPVEMLNSRVLTWPSLIINPA